MNIISLAWVLSLNNIMNIKKISIFCGVCFFVTCALAQITNMNIDPPVKNKQPEVSVPKTQPAVKQTPLTRPAPPQEILNKLDSPQDSRVVRPPSKTSEALLSSIYSGNLDLADILISQGADINCPNCSRSPVLVNAVGGNPKLAIWAMQRGADVSLAREGDGISPLISFLNNSFNYNFPKIDHLNAIKLALSKGANANHVDSRNNTVFHYLASLSGRTINQGYGYPDVWFEIYDLLQQYGGDINKINDSGLSPLIISIQRGGCNSRVINKFLSSGASVGFKTTDNKTAYDFVLERASVGDKGCNSVLLLLKGGVVSVSVDNIGDIKLGSVVGNDSKSLFGPWKGVLKTSSPVKQVILVEGVISEDGSIKLESETGITTYGSISNQTSESVTLNLRSRVPSNPATGASSFETQPFTALARLDSGVLRGSYTAPTDSGEFIICQSNTYSSVPDCQKSNNGNDMARAIGNIIGITRSLFGR
jgi:ankyrin repeat protein